MRAQCCSLSLASREHSSWEGLPAGQKHPVQIADSLIVCGEKNARHLYDKDAGKLEGAAVLFTVFILFLLSLNCFESPVIFLSCHNYKSLRITQDTYSQKGII